MGIALDWDDQAYRRDLARLFAQEAAPRNRALHARSVLYPGHLFGLFMFLTVNPDVYQVYSAAQTGLFQGAGRALIDMAA